MAMRVCELLAVPDLDLEVVVDGDLERVIRWVHTTELADPTRYLQGGEVILVSMGPEVAMSAIRRGLSMGAHRGVIGPKI